MNLLLFLPLAAIVLVIWLGRRIPLTGWRKRAAIAARGAAVAALCAALVGEGHRRLTEVPRQVVYLVDGSASVDAAQREWIARRIASLESQRPRRMERAVAVFGADARLAIPFDRPALDDPAAIRRAVDAVEVDRTATNLEGALLAIPGWLAEHDPETPAASSAGRTAVVLFSDGRETRGSAGGVLAAVRRLGIDVFPVPPPISGRPTAAWDQLAVPPVVQKGSPIPVRLVLANTSPRAKAAQVTVSVQGVALKRQRLSMRPGWQVFTVAVPTLSRGTVALDVRLDVPEDKFTDTRRAYTEVEGPPRILFASEQTTAPSMLANALRRREIEVAPVRPSELPIDPARLLDVDAVVLFNVPKSSISAEQTQALQRFVEEDGGGLVMVGLGGELASEVTTETPLDALLPVRYEPKGLQESKRRVCIVLLIDRSASMLGPRIAATKRAAVALVNQLQPEDLVGIFAFDTQPYVVAEVQAAGDIGPQLVEKLVKLRSSGGTDIYPALTTAANRLDTTGASLKHIILLSDGNTPFHREAYDALIKSFQLDRISVSTIGIGSAFINTEYLEWLARATGGTYYQLKNLEDLPKLMARDTEDQLGRLPFTEGLFRPTKTPQSDWFADTEGDWPPLRGYVTATAKPEARVDLTVNGGEGEEPLLARWTRGRGRVVAFTSDADTRWSPDWIRWPGFEGAWAHVVRWAMRPRLAEEVFVHVEQRGEAPQLVVEGAMSDPRGRLIAAPSGDEPGPGAEIPVSLVQTGRWRWQASLEQVPSGWYQLALEAKAPGAETGGAIFANRWIQLGTPAAAQELPGQPPLEPLLRQLARGTAGAYEMPDAALTPPTTSVAVIEPMFAWWLPLVILLVLTDVWLRGPSMLSR